MKTPSASHRVLISCTLILSSLAATLQAGSRTSTNYTIATDTTDGGGRRATSAAYTNDGSAGAVAGLSTVAAPAETVKHGYIGQLYDVTGLTLTAVSLNVNEATTDQLAAWQALDDATFLAVPAASVAWSVQSGPLTGIGAGGLATSGIVFQDTLANAQGVYLGQTGVLGLTVKNVNIDDYGTYAADAIDDAWQNQYFGLNNANAGPLLDPDGDGQTNAFEFTAGLAPNDPASRFTLTVAPVNGQPTQKKLIFSPRFADRIYTVKSKASLLTGSYLPLTNPSAPSDNAQERTITDLSAPEATKFYQVEITKP